MDRITSSDRAYGLLVVCWSCGRSSMESAFRADIDDQLFLELWMWEMASRFR